MLNGSAGEWLFRTPYTPYAQHGVLAYLPLMLLGRLAPGGEHGALLLLFHAFRIVGVFLYVFAVYDFIALFVCQPRWRRLGTALAAFGGGLGWITVFGLSWLWGTSLPLDFYSPESFGFLMIYGLPHLACARAFLLWALRDYLVQTGPLRARRAAAPGPGQAIRAYVQPGTYLRAALLWLGVGLMQPITVVSGWAVIGAHVLATGLWQAWRRRAGAVGWGEWPGFFRRALANGILSAPLVFYTLISFRIDPFLKQWESQNLIPSPGLFHYLLGFGLLLPFALLGIVPLLREAPWKGWLVVAWVAIFPLLAYAPFNLQRRLPEGIWVALIALALGWIEHGGKVAQRWTPRWLALSFFTALFLLLGGALAAASPGKPLFRPAAEVQAFQYLAEHSGPDDVVLAAFETANPLPAWANVRTVFGLGTESANGVVLRQQVTCFYGGCVGYSDAQRIQMLRELDVRYIIWGPEERLLGDWNPAGSPALRPIYQSGDYLILAMAAST
jgi:hypothetical protein